MKYPSLFLSENTDIIGKRIDQLHVNSKPLWGKMNSAQMLAHCCFPYMMINKEIELDEPWVANPGMKEFLKNAMTNEIDYTPNLPTFKKFIIDEPKDFEFEKSKLKNYILETTQKGASALIKNPHPLVGHLTEQEWNNLFYKHIDHHLKQFGV